ncbi:MAG: hypothetical protein IRZ28_10070 [Steroidobacteraceae bacterium]|nr:hypothetical protein [Steroidobacteraceae bacterium]
MFRAAAAKYPNENRHKMRIKEDALHLAAAVAKRKADGVKTKTVRIFE